MPIGFGINAFIFGIIPWSGWMINIILQMGEGKHTHKRETSSELHKVRSEWENKRGSGHQRRLFSGLWERWGGTKDQSLKVGTKPLTWEYYKLFC